MIKKSILKNLQKEKPYFFKNSFQNLFSWDELEFLLNFRPFSSEKRFHHLGKEKNFSWKHQAWVTDQTTYPPSLIGHLIQTHSCYFQDASRANRKINEVCKDLEETFNGDCDAHIFFNVSDNLQEGFGIHYDSSHNLIVQIEGKSEVKVWDCILENDSIEPVIHKTMNPGDAVFIPRNMSHCITSLSKRLSISFPVSLKTDKQKQDRSWISFAKKGTIA
jgi:Cupin superfamily protein